MEIIRLNHDLSVNLNLPINSMTILLFEKIFLNTTISKKIHKNQIIIEIKHKYNLIFLCLNKLDELQYVIFKQTPKKAAIKSILPYHTLTDLLYDMYKIGIKLYPKKDFK